METLKEEHGERQGRRQEEKGREEEEMLGEREQERK